MKGTRCPGNPQVHAPPDKPAILQWAGKETSGSLSQACPCPGDRACPQPHGPQGPQPCSTVPPYHGLSIYSSQPPNPCPKICTPGYQPLTCSPQGTKPLPIDSQHLNPALQPPESGPLPHRLQTLSLRWPGGSTPISVVIHQAGSSR